MKNIVTTADIGKISDIQGNGEPTFLKNLKVKQKKHTRQAVISGWSSQAASLN